MTFPSFDTDFLLWLNQSGNIFFDTIMLRLSSSWTWTLMLLAVIVLVFRDRPFKEALLILFGIILSVLLADQISSSLIKPLVCRLRPTHDPLLMFQIRIIEGRGGLYGFVSSHAANTFAIAMFLSMVFRHRVTAISLFVWATLVGVSRIYLAKHFPLDVLCGAMLGVVVGLSVYGLLHLAVTRLLDTSQQYYSNAYTVTGFVKGDMYILLASMALTLAYVLF